MRSALRASARLPWLAGQPVVFRGRRLLDATLAEAIPVQAPLRTATDVLVLQTRPEGVEHSGLSGPVGLLTDRYLRTINPALVALRRTRSERYDELSAWLGRRAAESAAAIPSAPAEPEPAGSPRPLNPTRRPPWLRTAGQPAICVIRPPADATPISQLEYRNVALQVAGSEGLRAAWMALEGEDPEVLDVLAGLLGRATASPEPVTSCYVNGVTRAVLPFPPPTIPQAAHRRCADEILQAHAGTALGGRRRRSEVGPFLAGRRRPRELHAFRPRAR